MKRRKKRIYLFTKEERKGFVLFIFQKKRRKDKVFVLFIFQKKRRKDKVFVFIYLQKKKICFNGINQTNQTNHSTNNERIFFFCLF